MAEQLGVNQGRRQRSQVDRDEWRLGARRRVMQRARDQFPAAAALAADQHRRIEQPGLPDQARRRATAALLPTIPRSSRPAAGKPPSARSMALPKAWPSDWQRKCASAGLV